MVIDLTPFLTTIITTIVSVSSAIGVVYLGQWLKHKSKAKNAIKSIRIVLTRIEEFFENVLLEKRKSDSSTDKALYLMTYYSKIKNYNFYSLLKVFDIYSRDLSLFDYSTTMFCFNMQRELESLILATERSNEIKAKFLDANNIRHPPGILPMTLLLDAWFDGEVKRKEKILGLCETIEAGFNLYEISFWEKLKIDIERKFKKLRKPFSKTH